MEVLNINNNLHQRIVLIMERDNMINNYYICALNNGLQAGTDLKQEKLKVTKKKCEAPRKSQHISPWLAHSVIRMTRPVPYMSMPWFALGVTLWIESIVSMLVLFELFLPCLLVNCHKQKEQENKSLSRQSNMEDPFNNKKK